MKKFYLHPIMSWFVSASSTSSKENNNSSKIDFLRVIPFLSVQFACIAVFWVGVSTIAVTTAIALYILRGMAISGFYHRFFAHKTFKTSRVMQCVFAILGALAMQKGPLWWTSYHRSHHRHTEQEKDIHSPVQYHFLWSHMGWFLSKNSFYFDATKVKDLIVYPELILIDKFYFIIPFTLGILLFFLGNYLKQYHPEFHTSGMQLFIWGFCISTTILFHSTAAVNSISHRMGYRTYPTKDNSRNNPLIALLSFGEGWHNNHHYSPASVKIGHAWWEIDVTYYMLKCLENLKLIWDLKY